MASATISPSVEMALGKLDEFPSFIVKAARNVVVHADRLTVTAAIRNDKEALKTLRQIIVSRQLLPQEAPSAFALPEVVKALTVFRSC